MPSSPADPGDRSAPLPAIDAQPAAAVLRALARAYDEALAATAAADLDGAAALLAAADALLAAPLQPSPADAELAGLRADAQAAHARLFAVVAELRDGTAAELARTRRGRRALAGYAGLRPLGDKFESRI